jgi:hypothetical protein
MTEKQGKGRPNLLAIGNLYRGKPLNAGIGQ